MRASPLDPKMDAARRCGRSSMPDSYFVAELRPRAQIQIRPAIASNRTLLNVIRTSAGAVLWSALLAIVLPVLDATLYASRLASMSIPTKLALPIRETPAATLRDSWNAPRPGGRRHEGIDIFAAKGTPVYAATEGIIIRRGQNRLGGNVLWILGPAGQTHYYAHLDRFAHLSIGERVQTGSVLGYVGNTGNARATPSHLHYGVYTRTGAINPFPLLVRSRS